MPPIPVVRFTRRAAAQIARARDWWLANRDKAPDAFDEEFDRIINHLESDPGFIGRPVLQEPTVRRILLQRIRYYVYFRVKDEAVEILSVWHASRGRDPDRS